MLKPRSFILLFFVVGVGCGSEDSSPGSSSGGSNAGGSGQGNAGNGGTGGAAGQTNNGGSAGVGTFNPDNPGVAMFFQFGSGMALMDKVSAASGYFVKSRYEDFNPPADATAPLGSCVMFDRAVRKECDDASDCKVKGQECVHEKNGFGEDDSATGRCVTPNPFLNVGSFTMDGFANGPQTFSYNFSKEGGYTISGTDGSNPPGFVFDQLYTFKGDGDPAQGLGAFSGQLFVSPELTLTSPPLIQTGGGMKGIAVSTSKDLTLTWSGATSNKTVMIELQGMGKNSGLCQVPDTGSFTIPSSILTGVGFGPFPITNALILTRHDVGEAHGEGMTFHEIIAEQVFTVNVQASP